MRVHRIVFSSLTWKCAWSKGGAVQFLLVEKMVPIDIHWCLLNINGDQQWLWAQWGSAGCVEAVAAVTVGHLRWCRFLWVRRAALVHCWWKYIAVGGDYVERVLCSWECALSDSVTVLFASGVVSMGINRRHSFRSNSRQFLITAAQAIQQVEHPCYKHIYQYSLPTYLPYQLYLFPVVLLPSVNSSSSFPEYAWRPTGCGHAFCFFLSMKVPRKVAAVPSPAVPREWSNHRSYMRMCHLNESVTL